MAIPTQTMQRLEALLVQAYSRLSSYHGDLLTPNSYAYLLTQAKDSVRGGISVNYAVYAPNSANNFGTATILPYSGASWSIAYPTLAVKYYDTTTYVSAGTMKLDAAFNGADGILRGGDSYLYFLPTNSAKMRLSLYGNTTLFQATRSSLMHGTYAALPDLLNTVPTTCNQPLYAANLSNQTSFVVNTFQPIASNSYAMPNEVDLDVSNLYYSLSNQAQTAVTSDRSQWFKPVFDALNSHIQKRVGTTFENYWRAQQYDFNKVIRDLYYKLYGRNLLWTQFATIDTSDEELGWDFKAPEAASNNILGPINLRITTGTLMAGTISGWGAIAKAQSIASTGGAPSGYQRYICQDLSNFPTCGNIPWSPVTQNDGGYVVGTYFTRPGNEIDISALGPVGVQKIYAITPFVLPVTPNNAGVGSEIPIGNYLFIGSVNMAAASYSNDLVVEVRS